jgi:hypothetical protein
MNKYGDRSIVALVLTPHDVDKREYQRVGMLFVNSTDMFAREFFFLSGRLSDNAYLLKTTR